MPVSPSIQHQTFEEQGFKAYLLRTDKLQLVVVPSLGARIISLKNLQSDREWMWHPEEDLKLFPNGQADDFAASTLVGTDECLPTIAPCSWNGRPLPDHGEVWNLPWYVDDDAWEKGVLRTLVDLPISPFTFERTIQVRAGEARLSYILTNRSSNSEKFLWALHPLLRLESGDRLMLPCKTRALLNGAPWLEALESTPEGGCEKLFATPVSEGSAQIVNAVTGDRLSFLWSPDENNTLGLWLTRGGWHGHHHFALEPTNGAADSLAQAAALNQCGRVSAFGSVRWSVILSLDP